MEIIHEYHETKLTQKVADAIATLACQAFADSGRTHADRVASMMAAANSREPEKTSCRRFVIWDDDQVVAHARTFVRQVIAGSVQIPVLGLATVCTDPNRRGQGLGATIARRALQAVGQPPWPDVNLFQTPVPEFYRKLNSKLVTNRFVDRTNAQEPDANPWRDAHVMVYPAEYDWPAGEIDLNGPEY